MSAAIKFIEHVTSQRLTSAQKIQTVALKALQEYAYQSGFTQLMPVMISPITDPLNHQVYPAHIDYEQRRLSLTASMIFHKQMALMNPGIEKIFIVSPNIRLELASIKDSKRHMLEFSQFDFEIRNATMYDVMDFISKMFVHVFASVKKQCAAELDVLGRTLPDLSAPLEIFSSAALSEKHGEKFEEVLSATITQPAFVTNYKREFYDREDKVEPGVYRNFDLIYPEGYGEGLSGAEREYEYDEIIRRMTELNMDLAPYKNYLSIARDGKLPATAGAGIGIQRLIRYLCGADSIADVCVFDRSVNSEFFV